MQQEKLAAAVETAGGACHKLNQPLQSAMMNLEILQARLPDDFSEADRLDLIKAHLEEMAQITHRLSRLSDFQTTEYVGEQMVLDLDQACSGNKKK